MEKIMRLEEDYKTGAVPDAAYHSFHPAEYPVAFIPVNRTNSDGTPVQDDDIWDKNAVISTLAPAKRYLPCHYFDFIGGSSTGA